jgi:hypothetical protein
LKKLYTLLLILFPFVELPAQNKGDLNNIPQGVNQMQNTIPETVPNAQFPFGQPLRLVKQQDRTPKKVFVLGVYASAVHAKWFSQEGKLLCQALAVASEPEIFWKGENAAEIISKISIPPEAGYLEPAEETFNGPSGKALNELYLAPLGLSRSDVWLCDLVPHSFMNQGQKNAITNHYVPLCEKYSLTAASIPEEPSDLVDPNRRNEILAEFEESKAETIILLGDDPIKWFLSFVSDCTEKRLSEFGENTETYGLQHSVSINGKTYTVIPLTHVRQGGALGTHSDKWEQLHNNWVANMNSRK